jgi:cell wall assembly regulator SMI1
MSTLETLARIQAWFAENRPDTLRFQSRASEDQIAAAEATLGMRFPDDYRRFLAAHNGQVPVEEFDWMPGTGYLFGLDQIVEAWSDEQSYYEEDPEAFGDFMDDDRIRFILRHPKRVPIANNEYGDGDATYLDFVPGPEGTVGQIIVMTSECEFEQIGENFTDFLQRYAALLESSKVHVSEDDGMLIVQPVDDGEYSMVPLMKKS